MDELVDVPASPAFFGMFYPYWVRDFFERYYDIVYPTYEEKFRNALAQTEYDYNVIITDSSKRYEDGNYNAFLAFAARNSESELMLFHEFDHLMGLQEEYSQTGTNLQFAPKTVEPWFASMQFIRR